MRVCGKVLLIFCRIPFGYRRSSSVIDFSSFLLSLPLVYEFALSRGTDTLATLALLFSYIVFVACVEANTLAFFEQSLDVDDC